MADVTDIDTILSNIAKLNSRETLLIEHMSQSINDKRKASDSIQQLEGNIDKVKMNIDEANKIIDRMTKNINEANMSQSEISSISMKIVAETRLLSALGDIMANLEVDNTQTAMEEKQIAKTNYMTKAMYIHKLEVISNSINRRTKLLTKNIEYTRQLSEYTGELHQSNNNMEFIRQQLTQHETELRKCETELMKWNTELTKYRTAKEDYENKNVSMRYKYTKYKQKYLNLYNI